MENPSATETSGDTIATPARELRAVHACEAQKRDGQICGRYVATIFEDGRWLCPQHKIRRPKTPGGKPVKLPRPPLTNPTTPAEAVTLMGWAAGQAALGRITKQHASSISEACREFRIAFEANAEYQENLQRTEALGRHITAIMEGAPEHVWDNLKALRRLLSDGDAEQPVEPALRTFYDASEDDEPSA